ncbi:PepSY domain-containing protein [Piscinibacter sp. Jin2]|uniref:PepSY domain-containing protein n=1 Tax=Aquariibacter lacus TaxID=2801332 RepID=A0A9X0XE54_9BURK|nr:PepSY domain-containing protein [Piscinibacter lacus]MBL0719886.1 PepSY domain-containing protein [Piscinibacter lacus]
MTFRKTLVLVLALAAAGAAQAGPSCTEEPVSKWLTAEQMDAKLRTLGYVDDVRKLHVSKGKCWEIDGHDKAGKAVEVYFHPISGVIVQENRKD